MSQLPPLGVDSALNVPSTVLFCPYSGSLLQIDEHEGLAKSALTGYSVRLKGRSGRRGEILSQRRRPPSPMRPRWSVVHRLPTPRPFAQR